MTKYNLYKKEMKAEQAGWPPGFGFAVHVNHIDCHIDFTLTEF